MATQDSETGEHGIEKRKFPRFKAGLAIELLPQGAAVSTRTQTSEVGLGGCYVEMNFTLAIGTKLHVNFWVEGEKLSTDAVVMTHHPGFGNGLQFTNLSPQDTAKLERFLASLDEQPER